MRKYPSKRFASLILLAVSVFTLSSGALGAEHIQIDKCYAGVAQDFVDCGCAEKAYVNAGKPKRFNFMQAAISGDCKMNAHRFSGWVQRGLGNRVWDSSEAYKHCLIDKVARKVLDLDLALEKRKKNWYLDLKDSPGSVAQNIGRSKACAEYLENDQADYPTLLTKYPEHFSDWPSNPNFDPDYVKALRVEHADVYEHVKKLYAGLERYDVLGITLGQDLEDLKETYPSLGMQNALAKPDAVIQKGGKPSIASLYESVSKEFGYRVRSQPKNEQHKVLNDRFNAFNVAFKKIPKKQRNEAFGPAWVLQKFVSPQVFNVEVNTLRQGTRDFYAMTASDQETLKANMAESNISSLYIKTNSLQQVTGVTVTRQFEGELDLQPLVDKLQQKYQGLAPFQVNVNATGAELRESKDRPRMLEYFEAKGEQIRVLKPEEEMIRFQVSLLVRPVKDRTVTEIKYTLNSEPRLYNEVVAPQIRDRVYTFMDEFVASKEKKVKPSADIKI